MSTRIRYLGLYMLYLGFMGLGIYEFTAKSGEWLGWRLPGWEASRKAEKNTRWNPPTGIVLVDRFLHESVEATHFYGTLFRPDP